MKRGLTLIVLLGCALGAQLLAQTPQKKAAANSSGAEMALKNCLDRVETVEWILRCAQNDLILCWVSSPEAFVVWSFRAAGHSDHSLSATLTSLRSLRARSWAEALRESVARALFRLWPEGCGPVEPFAPEATSPLAEVRAAPAPRARAAAICLCLRRGAALATGADCTAPLSK